MPAPFDLCPFLPLYVERRLCDDTAERFQRHLRVCPHCRREVHRLLAARAVGAAREFAGALRETVYDLACAAAVVGLVVTADGLRWLRGRLEGAR